MVKNYPHNVIRLRKGKPGASQVYWLIVILNKKKASSHGFVEKLGFLRHGPSGLLAINNDRLVHYLNKGSIIKKSVKKLIYWYAALSKYYIQKLKNIRKKRMIKKLKNKKKVKKFKRKNVINKYKSKS